MDDLSEKSDPTAEGRIISHMRLKWSGSFGFQGNFLATVVVELLCKSPFVGGAELPKAIKVKSKFIFPGPVLWHFMYYLG